MVHNPTYMMVYRDLPQLSSWLTPVSIWVGVKNNHGPVQTLDPPRCLLLAIWGRQLDHFGILCHLGWKNSCDQKSM